MSNSIPKLCAELGIEIVPTKATRGPFQTSAAKVMKAIGRQHGEGHLTLVLRVITESEHNASELNQFAICGVSDVLLAHPEWANAGLRLLEAFDQISLADLRDQARANRDAAPQREAMATMIYNELCRIKDAPLSRSDHDMENDMPTENDLLYGTTAIAKYLEMSLTLCRDLIRAGAIPTFTMPGSSTRCARKSSLNGRWQEYEARAISGSKSAEKARISA